jgi:uncharacterized RDD family membrane protein YckC
MSVPTFMNSATFGTRTVAFAIDLAFLAVSWLFLFLLLAVRFFSIISIEDPLAIVIFFATYPIVFFISFFFVHMAYCTLMHAWLGQTLGKMIMGIRVVTIDNRQASPGIAFLRWTGYILSMLPLASGFLWAVVDKDHCAWHDWLSQTRVVSAEMT